MIFLLMLLLYFSVGAAIALWSARYRAHLFVSFTDKEMAIGLFVFGLLWPLILMIKLCEFAVKKVRGSDDAESKPANE